MNVTRLLVALTALNFVLLMLSFMRLDALAADDAAPVLRGRALEIVDDHERVRASIGGWRGARSGW